MLEKIGLPSKPSMKGNNWVVDASHCQGCASQFTFINRKHHCRRCGGLFCGTCTSQRMYLRGQGDSAVRICDACKKIEEAARFEMRHGSRTKPPRAKIEETMLLREIVGSHSKEIPSSSSISPPILPLEEKLVTVDSLRQQAIEEKQKHKNLKKEGKNKEALEAFKRGRDLERQATSLELAERKNRRKAASSSNTPLIDDLKCGKRVSNKEDDDIFTELNKLGWNESEGKIPKTSSAEDEFSLLLKETSQPVSNPSNRSEVVALKKAAVALKREGKLAEAKEELKKAKTLEKRIEEEELLNGGEDSEDEISAMIREMGDVKEDDMPFLESVVDENVEVTDADLIDPEMEAALASFGWTEEAEKLPKNPIGLPKNRLPIQKKESKNPIEPPKSRLAIKKELISSKKRALALRKEGRVEEAEEELNKCGTLEKQLANWSDASVRPTDTDFNDSEMETALASLGWTDEPSEEQKKTQQKNSTGPPKSRLTIQKEILAVKKKALVMRREGRVEEAEEELKKCEALEKQLAPRIEDDSVTEPANVSTLKTNGLEMNEDEEPKPNGKTKPETQREALATKRRSLGKHEEAEQSSDEKVGALKKAEEVERERSPGQAKEKGENRGGGKGVSGRERFKLQQEVLGHKRAAMKMRREGRVEEAESELNLARELEAKLEEAAEDDGGVGDVHVEDFMDGDLLSALKEIGVAGISPNKKVKIEDNNDGKLKKVEGIDEADILRLKEEIKEEKKKAVRLKREGNVTEALRVLRNAKLMEANFTRLTSF